MKTAGETQHNRASMLVKKSWRAFNRWRKRYLWIRLLFLLLFGAYVCREAFFPVTPRLVRMGAEAILASWEPRLVDCLARLRKVRLARQLQVALGRTADRDGDGVLNEQEEDWIRGFGLEPEEVREKSVHADLARLMAACHRAGLLPKSYTVRVARRDARFAAVAEVENLNRPARDKIDGILKVWDMPDYGRWKTWRTGTERLLEYLDEFVFLLGRPRTVAVWLLFCFFLSLIVASLFHKRKFTVGLLTGLCIASAVVAYGFLTSLYLPWVLRNHGIPISWVVAAVTAFLCLSMASSGYAGKVSSGKRSRRFYVCTGAAGLGIVLIAWGTVRVVSGPALDPDGETVWRFLAFQFPACIRPIGLWCSEYDWLLWWVWVPTWLHWALSGIGAASLAAGLRGCLRLRKLRLTTKGKGSAARPDAAQRPQKS